MARISAGVDFGQAVAQQTGLDSIGQVAQPTAVGRIGERMVVEGMRAEQQAQHALRQEQQQLAQARDAADRARASSVLANTRDGIADVVAQIDQEVQDGRLPKADAAKAWRERSGKIIEASLKDAPETHRAVIQQDLQGLVGRFDSRIGESVRKRDQADTRADLSTTLEALQRQAVGDYAGARAQAVAALDSLGPAAGMAADQVAKAKQAWVEGAAYTRAFTAVNAAKTDNRALSAVEQAITSNTDLDPQRQAQLLAHVENYRAANEARALRQAQHAEIVAARRDREAAQAFDVLQGWALAGKAADPQASAGLVAKLDPTRLAAYRALAAEIPARTAAAMLPLSGQQAQLDALIARRTAGGTSQELEKEIERRQKVLDQSRADYQRDPLRAAAERGVIDVIAPLDLSSMDGIAAGLMARVEQANTAATRAGRPVSPLLPEEASRLADMLGTLSPAAQARNLAQFATVLPPGMLSAMAGQIDAKNKPLALAIAVASTKTTHGRSVGELILRGAQAVRDKSIKEDGAAESGLKAQLSAEVGDALQGRAREDVIAAARLIYLAKQAEGTGTDAANAVRLAVGGDIVEHAGRRVPVPAGVDLAAKLQSYPRTAIERQAPDGAVYLPGGRTMGVPEFLAGLPAAQLEPVGLGRYVVRAGGSLAMSQSRRPIVIEVNQ